MPKQILLDEEWLTVESHQNYLSFIQDNGVLDKLSAFLCVLPVIKYFDKVEI
ncbi:hypothetical protein [Pseudoalteromonas sp. R3]|uniref:hypothetical protein n=1 Tax=Pseudoalteromonas sp. R3 TaxID=1709477 RepID=UPI000AF3D63B|nr:hypothetical protein [Pseudoalteromonas sp. R3]